MRPSTNNRPRPRPRRRGFPYRALVAIRPDLARQLVEPVEATLCKNQHTKRRGLNRHVAETPKSIWFPKPGV